MTVRTRLSLLRWLGPWSGDGMPAGIEREELRFERPGHEPLRAWLYRRRDQAPLGNVLVAHGLMPQGPADPRLDRLMRVLADAGLCAVVPFLPDYMALRFVPRVAEDFARAAQQFPTLPQRASDRRIGLLSISYGAYPMLRLLANAGSAPTWGGAALFGGYGDPRATIRYCCGVEVGPGLPAPDRLNTPGVGMHVLDTLDPSVNPAPVREALRALIERTWGRPADQRPDPELTARELGASLADPERALFRLAAGLEPGSRAALDDAIRRSPIPETMDARPHLATVAMPVHLMHARSDDVIPYTETVAIRDALPATASVRTYITGLFEHAGSAGGPGRVSTLARELATFARMAGAVAHICTRPS